MKATLTLLGLALCTLGNPVFADGYGGSNGEKGAYVCFARDFTVMHTKSDPETEDCVQAYYRGQGICLSHAKKIAIEKCTTFSKNKGTCRIDLYKDCYVR